VPHQKAPRTPAHARDVSALRWNVVPLRPHVVPDEPAARGRETVIDLQTPIDCLRSIKSDLEVYYWEPPGPGDARPARAHEVAFWIRLIGDRTGALEALALQKGSPLVVAYGLADDEHDAVVAAAKVLNQWIPEDAAFPKALAAVREILAATDRIGLGAAGATPAQIGRAHV